MAAPTHLVLAENEFPVPLEHACRGLASIASSSSQFNVVRRVRAKLRLRFFLRCFCHLSVLFLWCREMRQLPQDPHLSSRPISHTLIHNSPTLNIKSFQKHPTSKILSVQFCVPSDLFLQSSKTINLILLISDYLGPEAFKNSSPVR